MSAAQHMPGLPTFDPRRSIARVEPPGLGDDIACFACGAKALDTGLECNECGADNYEAVTGMPFGAKATDQEGSAA